MEGMPMEVFACPVCKQALTKIGVTRKLAHPLPAVDIEALTDVHDLIRAIMIPSFCRLMRDSGVRA
jgi:hypothetical protein